MLRLPETILIILLVCLGSWAQAAGNAVDEARALAKRLIPSAEKHIVFEQIEPDEGRDVFELDGADGKVVIRGNSANSMAAGLNRYLKYHCHTSVSWYLDDLVELPNALPAIERKERIVARTERRFFLNYCTFGYTMPWWQWNEWERFIDWMALNGINMPLAITGQEAVWLKVWSELGLKDDEIRSYMTGPAHLPWHRMTNMDRWGGPLPHSWLEQQAELQKKIVARERALGMTPVLPAFAGHVPPELKRLYPDAAISRMSSWGGFPDKYRSYFLDPLDPLFAKIQKAFLNEQQRLYGTDHIYGIDPFNEIVPPSWEPDYLARVSGQIYDTLIQCDPKATWLQMTWLFYYDRSHWTNPRINAFLNAVPKGKMILLDYFGENTEVWKLTDAYFGQPFVWCYLGNFGGNTMLAGNLAETGRRIEHVIAEGGSNFTGLGSTLEALDINPIMYEYVFDKVWGTPIDDKDWINAWADRRTGMPHEGVRKAWAWITEHVYKDTARLGQGTLTNARPSMTGHGNWTTNPAINYDNAGLFRAWEQMLGFDGLARDAYCFDVVNIGRQVLGNHFKVVRDRFAEAYANKDIKALNEQARVMRSMLADMDLLLSCHKTFSLKRWIDGASQFGKDDAEKAYYRHNARNIVSTWGDKAQSLNDYANRSLSGMMKDYYGMRWNLFLDDVLESVEQGKEWNAAEFDKIIKQKEKDWVEHDAPFAGKTAPDAVKTARALVNKYKPLIIPAGAK